MCVDNERMKCARVVHMGLQIYDEIHMYKLVGHYIESSNPAVVLYSCTWIINYAYLDTCCNYKGTTICMGVVHARVQQYYKYRSCN